MDLNAGGQLQRGSIAKDCASALALTWLTAGTCIQAFSQVPNSRSQTIPSSGLVGLNAGRQLQQGGIANQCACALVHRC